MPAHASTINTLPDPWIAAIAAIFVLIGTVAVKIWWTPDSTSRKFPPPSFSPTFLSNHLATTSAFLCYLTILAGDHHLAPESVAHTLTILTAISCVAFACCMISIRFFGRPRFLIPPRLRDQQDVHPPPPAHPTQARKPDGSWRRRKR